MIEGPTSHSFISQRLRRRYVDWGNPDAPPLIPAPWRPRPFAQLGLDG